MTDIYYLLHYSQRMTRVDYINNIALLSLHCTTMGFHDRKYVIIGRQSYLCSAWETHKERFRSCLKLTILGVETICHKQVFIYINNWGYNHRSNNDDGDVFALCIMCIFSL